MKIKKMKLKYTKGSGLDGSRNENNDNNKNYNIYFLNDDFSNNTEHIWLNEYFERSGDSDAERIQPIFINMKTPDDYLKRIYKEASPLFTNSSNINVTNLQQLCYDECSNNTQESEERKEQETMDNRKCKVKDKLFKDKNTNNMHNLNDENNNNDNNNKNNINNAKNYNVNREIQLLDSSPAQQQQQILFFSVSNNNNNNNNNHTMDLPQLNDDNDTKRKKENMKKHNSKCKRQFAWVEDDNSGNEDYENNENNNNNINNHNNSNNNNIFNENNNYNHKIFNENDEIDSHINLVQHSYIENNNNVNKHNNHNNNNNNNDINDGNHKNVNAALPLPGMQTSAENRNNNRQMNRFVYNMCVTIITFFFHFIYFCNIDVCKKPTMKKTTIAVTVIRIILVVCMQYCMYYRLNMCFQGFIIQSLYFFKKKYMDYSAYNIK